MVKTDETLIIEYYSGNTEAFEEIFQRYKKRILNFSLRLLNNLADAEDVVGELFFILMKKKNSYSPKGKFSTWLYTIAYNRCIDKIRRRRKLVFPWYRKKENDAYEEIEIADTAPLASENVEKKETAELVKKAIDTLPQKYKEVIIMREYQDLHYDEIAKILGWSASKVKVMIFRARKMLKKELLPILKEVA